MKYCPLSLSLSPFTGHGHLVEWKEELSSIVYYGYRSFIKTFRFRPELNQKLSSRFLKFRSNSSTFGSHKLLMLRFSNLSGYFIANEKRAKFFRKFSVQILIGRGIMFSISNFFIIFPISVTMPRQVDQEPSVN